jgi:carboxylesterase type B
MALAEAETAYGKVRGRWEEGVDIFLGGPYGGRV